MKDANAMLLSPRPRGLLRSAIRFGPACTPKVDQSTDAVYPTGRRFGNEKSEVRFYSTVRRLVIEAVEPYVSWVRRTGVFPGAHIDAFERFEEGLSSSLCQV